MGVSLVWIRLFLGWVWLEIKLFYFYFLQKNKSFSSNLNAYNMWLPKTDHRLGIYIKKYVKKKRHAINESKPPQTVWSERK